MATVPGIARKYKQQRRGSAPCPLPLAHETQEPCEKTNVFVFSLLTSIYHTYAEVCVHLATPLEGKGNKKIVYTSRFVRVILAQGPC